jgi:mRNA interferase MazF
MVERFDVFLVNLDSTPSADAKNTRPCVIISPDEINRNVGHVIIAPLSSPKGKYPTRVPINFLNGTRSVVLDQIRTVDKSRLVKKIGLVDKDQQASILDRLVEMFAV